MRDPGTPALEKLRTLVGYGTARFFISHNLHLLDWTSQTGMWDMPALKPVNVCPKRLLAFNEALHFQGDRENVGVHFFIDDYQFERIWTRPEKYIRALDGFCCVLTPDFSMYLDVPAPLRIWNHSHKTTLNEEGVIHYHQYTKKNGKIVRINNERRLSKEQIALVAPLFQEAYERNLRLGIKVNPPSYDFKEKPNKNRAKPPEQRRKQ